LRLCVRFYVAPMELGIAFRGECYNYTAPTALEWVPNAAGTHKYLTNSTLGFYGRGAGFRGNGLVFCGRRQDFTGSLLDFPGGGQDFAGAIQDNAGGGSTFIADFTSGLAVAAAGAALGIPFASLIAPIM